MGHDGGGGGHVTRLVLVPELKAGFLVYFNRWPVQCIYPLTDKLFEHFARPGYSKEWTPRKPGPPDRRLEGLYRNSGYVHETLFKFLVLLGAADEKRVSVQDDGTLRIADDLYYPVGPLLYRQERSDKRVAFRAGPRAPSPCTRTRPGSSTSCGGGRRPRSASGSSRPASCCW